MDESIGCIAPYSIATMGNFVMFLSDKGIMMFDGNSFKYVGYPIEKDLRDLNRDLLEYAYGEYNEPKNQYWLLVPFDNVNTNRKRIFIFDLSRQIWLPPYTDINAQIISNYRDSNNNTQLMFGDHQGYVYDLETGEFDRDWET